MYVRLHKFRTPQAALIQNFLTDVTHIGYRCVEMKVSSALVWVGGGWLVTPVFCSNIIIYHVCRDWKKVRNMP